MKKKLMAVLTVAASLVCMSACSISSDAVADLNPEKYITAISDYSNLTLEAALREVTDEMVDNRIQSNLANSMEDVEVSGRALKNGDIANINYEGKIDGV